jgi:hypothetical protein
MKVKLGAFLIMMLFISLTFSIQIKSRLKELKIDSYAGAYNSYIELKMETGLAKEQDKGQHKISEMSTESSTETTSTENELKENVNICAQCTTCAQCVPEPNIHTDDIQ